MATQLQLRRGTELQNDAFIGAEGEVTYDTTTGGLRVHDGTTAGGKKVVTLIDVQYPTSDNNYTWYRKYSDGWVEQGGVITNFSAREVTGRVTIPLPMSSSLYSVFLCARSARGDDIDWNFAFGATSKSTTQFSYSLYGIGTSDIITGMSWHVEGMGE